MTQCFSHTRRCPIFHRGSRFYADWRDKYGVRHRKAFVLESAALVFEKEQKSMIRDQKRESHQMLTVRTQFPVDVIENLDEIAPLVGFSGYKSLIPAYVAQGIQKDLYRLDGFLLPVLAESLRKRGLDEPTISSVLSEVKARRKPLYSKVDTADSHT